MCTAPSTGLMWACLAMNGFPDLVKVSSVPQDRNQVSLPLRLEGQPSACTTTLQVLRRSEFESQLLRSGVLAVDSAGSPIEAIMFVRGAPASIEQLIGTNQVPEGYRQACSLLQAWD